MLLMFYNLLNSQNISINNCEKRLVTYLLGQLRQKKGAIGGSITGVITEKRDNNWTVASFVHNESEITTWISKYIASISKVQNPKASRIFKIRTSFLNLKLQINRLAQAQTTPAH